MNRVDRRTEIDNIFSHDWKPISEVDSVCNKCNQELMQVTLEEACPEINARAGVNKGEDNGS